MGEVSETVTTEQKGPGARPMRPRGAARRPSKQKKPPAKQTGAYVALSLTGMERHRKDASGEVRTYFPEPHRYHGEPGDKVDQDPYLQVLEDDEEVPWASGRQAKLERLQRSQWWGLSESDLNLELASRGLDGDGLGYEDKVDRIVGHDERLEAAKKRQKTGAGARSKRKPGKAPAKKGAKEASNEATKGKTSKVRAKRDEGKAAEAEDAGK